ncbi:hypothetical protein DBR17_14310 [Sphingomonas sp. HMWF008]|nr:hypothetical protein DBR17_14310 [Sphingomonas sp. HMWF008]
MPYRFAWPILLFALLPAILIAFWPGYFGNLPRSSFAFHAHGLTASAWVLLVLAQSWTASTRRFASHRWLARAVLVAVPLFAGGAALAMQSMAVKFVTKSEPFYAALGARLGLDDVVASVSLVWMVRAAILARRRVGLHAAYMLSTVLLVLSPIIARLPVPHVPHLGELFTAAVALALYATRPRDGWPFLLVVALATLRAVQFETVAASATWARLVGMLADVPAAALALPATLAAAAAIWTVWPWQRGAASVA